MQSAWLAGVLCLSAEAFVAAPVATPAVTRLAAAPFAKPFEVQVMLINQDYVMSFDAFGFKEGECIVRFGEGGGVTFSAGMVARETGEWRVVAGDPADGENPSDIFVEFAQPMTELYSELYNVPGGVVYWRGRILSNLTIVDGLGISELVVAKTLTPQALLAKLQGITFQREGTFTAVPAREARTVPEPVNLELLDDVPANEPAATNPDVAPPTAKDPAAAPRRVRKAPPGASDKGFGRVSS